MTRLVRIEVLRLLRRADVLLILASLLALFAFATLDAEKHAVATMRTQSNFLAEEAERLSRLANELRALDAGEGTPGRFSDPRNIGRVGRSLAARYAVLEPGPMAALATGVRDLLPSQHKVTTFHFSSIEGEYDPHPPLRLLTGVLDPAHVIAVLLPLAIIVICVPVLTAEPPARARLFPVLAGAASRMRRGRLIAVTVLAGGMTMALLALFAALADARGTPADWLILSALMFGHALLWIGLCAALASVLARPATLVTTAVCLWAATTFAVPAVATTLIDRWHPVPSRIAVLAAERQVILDSDRDHARLLARYLHDHPDAAAPEDAFDVPEWLVRFHILQAEIDAGSTPKRVAMREVRRARFDRLDGMRWVSPALAVESALQRMAGSHPRRFLAFEAAVDAFHGQWTEYFLPRVLGKVRVRAGQIEELPRFTFAEDRRADAREAFATGLVCIAGGLALIMLYGPMASRRHAVRRTRERAAA